ncbi:uncharacterized protein [Epargyreus clarus]|uniref:uncharacterized protein n=1 Tax=Epargyreus clarus TaxID=520877 RepID=UPI003C2B5676
MELLLSVVLAGLISYTHAQSTGAYTDAELIACFGNRPTTYNLVTFPDGTVLNNTNSDAVLSAKTFSQKPTIIYPYRVDKYYSFYFFCVDGVACVKKHRLLWHMKNILNSNFDNADTHIPYTAPELTTRYRRCIFLSGVQAEKLPAGNLNQAPEDTDIPKLIRDDKVTASGATYCRTEKLESPPPATPTPPSCGCNKSSDGLINVKVAVLNTKI